MDVGLTLVTDGQAAVAAEPSQRPLDDPAVAAQAFAAVNASSGDTGRDAPSGADPPAVGKVVALIRMQLGWAPMRPAAALTDRRHGVDRRLEKPAVVRVGRSEADRERGRSHRPRRGAWSRACPDPWDWGRSLRPPLAGTLALSRGVPAPIDRVRHAQPIEQDVVQPLPHARSLPITQPPLARHA